jgi:ethanolamine permease
MAMSKADGVSYATRDQHYFERRGLKRHAGIWSLWALGVGAVISGHFSGWNLGFATGGWGGLMGAAALIALMYLGLVASIAEMSSALPHTGAAYSFARTAMGPWGGFATGLFENVEYVITPAVVCTFISAYFGSITGLDAMWYPLLWVVFFAVFLALNIFGVALSYRVTLTVTLLSLGGLLFFYLSAVPHIDFGRFALDIGVSGEHLPEGNGPLLPFGWSGVLATLPFAVWLFLAIEQVPLAAEESIEPQRDLPRGILLAFGTLLLSAAAIVILNPAIAGVGAHRLGSSLEPALDGIRAIYGEGAAPLFGVVALIGLVASFHTIVYAQGRQIYSLSRAGYFPSALSVTHSRHRTPHVAMVAGAALGLCIMLAIWFANGGGGTGETQQGDDIIGSVLLNMAVFGAMLSYVMQALSFIVLRRLHPAIARPFRSPLGIPGAVVTILIAVVTLTYQLQDPNFNKGVVWVIVWCGVGLAYFALVGRHRLILSPEEEFALSQRKPA